MGRAYNPQGIIKSNGVHTFHLGKPLDPMVLVFEAYCIQTEQTFSETCRDMLGIAMIKMGLLKDPGVNEGQILKPGEGELTDKYYKFRKEAEKMRVLQLERLEKKAQEDAEKAQSESVKEVDGVGF